MSEVLSERASGRPEGATSGTVVRLEYDPNRSARIALVRSKKGAVLLPSILRLIGAAAAKCCPCISGCTKSAPLVHANA